MTLELKAYIPTSGILGVPTALQSLSDQLRPTHFSSEEGEKNANDITDVAKFNKFIVTNKFGFYLFSARARYNIVINPTKTFSQLQIDTLTDDLTEQDAIAILEMMAESDSHFAFAAHPDEYTYRNRYIRKFEGGQFETWIGRDLERYFPGVYWMTLLPRQHKEILPCPPTSLTEAAKIIQLHSGQWLIKAYEKANEWPQYADRLDKWCANQAVFFSKKRIESKLDAGSNLMALNELASQWR